MFESIAARVIVGIIAALGSLRVGTGLYAWKVTEALERPTYKVVEKLSDGVEIRRYEPYLIAETIVDGVGFREPTAEGFRACAGYIFGKNKRRGGGWFSSTVPSSSKDPDYEKMAMTAPVRIAGETPPELVVQGGATRSRVKKTKVSFVIGTKYSLQTAPIPLNNSVKLREVPAHTLAVRTFSGPPPKDKRVQKELKRLEKALAKAGKVAPRANAETLVYGYHDPFFTPNVLRRNEVALVLEGYA